MAGADEPGGPALPPLRTAVVTGAGRGIGRAVAERLAREGVRVVAADVDEEGVASLASQTAAVPWTGDCASAEGVEALIAVAEAELGRIDLFVANAGIATGLGLDASDDDWDRAIGINVLAHVRAARAVVPRWLADGGGGRFLVTASAAGMLTMVGDAPYSVTKHGAVAFAEWLSATYRDQGVVVQALCPQGVRTAMIDGVGPVEALLRPGALATEDVADAVWAALQTRSFYVLPHPEVAGMYAARAQDPDGWLAAMNRLQSKLGLVPAFVDGDAS
jgi:NAD(P)-dependent dehydrogenase (short-subunit alcohol dehydrogenase family)